MKALIIKNLSKKYEIGKSKTFTALKPTNLTFDQTGLVSIIGKSGSGKSTLINLIARIDTPTTGEIYYNGVPYSSLNKRQRCDFYNRQIGIVFQQYNLLEDKTVLLNAMLPLLIGGVAKKKAAKIAKGKLLDVGIKNEQFNLYPKDLSGGEKQRVAIARSIVNAPYIVLCDEPTGALDSVNSKNVMNIFKKISKDRLVILVSHNLQIVKEYSDRIIEISDGKIIKDQLIQASKNINETRKEKGKKNSNWINKIALTNYKKRIKRNLFSSLAFTIALSMFYVVIGFVINKDLAISNACYQQFDFGSGTISEEKSSGGSGPLKLVKSYRPNYNELASNLEISKKYEILPNFSAIFPQNIQITYDSQSIEDINLTSVYSFDVPYIDEGMLVNGRLPEPGLLSEMVVNQNAYRLIKRTIKKELLDEPFLVHHETVTTYIDEGGDYITDTFIFDMTITITGVVKEINYLSSPKIFFSYSLLSEYMKENVLSNLSTYFDEKITWYDRVVSADDYSLLSGYSYCLFLKDINYRKEVLSGLDFGDKYTFTSQSLLLTNSLMDFLDVAEYGFILFLCITIIGAVLILSIMSFTNYSDDYKNSAILSSLGASDKQIQEIYLSESLLNGLLSFFTATGIAFLLSKLINEIISNYIDVQNLISIPFLELFGIKFLFPLLMLVGIVVIVLLSTIIPINFSKRKTIKGELQSL